MKDFFFFLFGETKDYFINNIYTHIIINNDIFKNIRNEESIFLYLMCVCLFLKIYIYIYIYIYMENKY